jgi:hypothetical protein
VKVAYREDVKSEVSQGLCQSGLERGYSNVANPRLRCILPAVGLLGCNVGSSKELAMQHRSSCWQGAALHVCAWCTDGPQPSTCEMLLLYKGFAMHRFGWGRRSVVAMP